MRTSRVPDGIGALTSLELALRPIKHDSVGGICTVVATMRAYAYDVATLARLLDEHEIGLAPSVRRRSDPQNWHRARGSDSRQPARSPPSRSDATDSPVVRPLRPT